MGRINAHLHQFYKFKMNIVINKNLAIQKLRAIAIFMVIIQHLRNRIPTPNWYHEIFVNFSFWSGVDIFFAISGYLICKTFLRDMSNNSSKLLAFKNFWMRRVGRLFPALLFWSFFSVLVALISNSVAGSDPLKIAKGAVFAILGISNFYWARCIGSGQFLALCGNPDFNGVTWSLSLEWQLYFLLTLFFIFLGKWRAIFIMLGVSLVVSIFSAPSFSYPWVFRPQAFTLGALLYLIIKKEPLNLKVSIRKNLSRILLLVGIIICIASPTRVPQPFLVPLLAVGAILCLFSAILNTNESGGVGGNFSLWVGERSYSIYLCHLPCILVSREIIINYIGYKTDFLNIIISFSLTFFIIFITANFSYRFIEIPFQKIIREKFIAA